MKKSRISLIVLSTILSTSLLFGCGGKEGKSNNNVENTNISEQEEEKSEPSKAELKDVVDSEDNVDKEDKVSEKVNEPLEKDTIKPIVDLYKSSTKISVNKLLREPDKYAGKTVIVSGIVNQVLDTDENTIQLGISEDVTDDAMMLIYERKKDEQRFLEGDYVSAIVEFTGIQSLEMVVGANKSFPVGEVKKIDLGYVMSSTMIINYALKEIGGNYKVIYDGTDYIGQQIDKSCYMFKVYDMDNKCYKEERLASEGHNVYWYNKDTFKLSESIYEHQYQ